MEYLKEFNYDARFQSVVIAGASQHGKTTHGINLCKMLAMGGYNILILDNKRKFTKLDPTKVIHTIQDVTGKGLQILQPHKFASPDAMYQFFEDLSWQCYIMKNIVYAVDELHSWFKDKRSHIPSYELFCKECHNEKSSFIAMFQSPADIPNYVMRNSEHRFCLYLDLEPDIDAMKRVIGKEMKLFSESEIPKYEGLYKKQGEKVKLFKVEKTD